MTVLLKFQPKPDTRSSHRTYRDRDPDVPVFCRLVGDESDLLRRAAGNNHIETRQAPGSGWIPASMTNTIVEALRALDIVGGSTDPRAERLEREWRRRLLDGLARIRVRCNRRVLAGTTETPIDGVKQRVMLLVFVKPGITSCDWHLAVKP